MRVVILTQYYAPEPVPKPQELAQGLAQRGHAVVVITGFPNYPAGKVYPGTHLKPWTWETLNGIRILRVPLYPSHSRSGTCRSLNYLSFAISAGVLGAALGGSADVMWVYHPPLTVGISALWIHLLRRASFIYDVNDMWPETVAASGMMSNGVAIRLLERLARFVYARAAAIAVVSPGFKRNLIAKGVPPGKIHIIPNWADETIYRPTARSSELGERYGLSGRFNVMFAGNMGPAQGLHAVLQAAALTRGISQIQFILIGDGIDLPGLKAEAQRLGLDNVQFIDRQPSAAMPRFFAWADALLVQLRDDALFHMTIPSKTLAYLASGRPIVCAMRGDGADVVRQAGAGLVCLPDNPQALAQAVCAMYAKAPCEREAMGAAGRQAFLDGYTRQMLLGRYEALLQEAAQRRQSFRKVSHIL